MNQCANNKYRENNAQHKYHAVFTIDFALNVINTRIHAHDTRAHTPHHTNTQRACKYTSECVCVCIGVYYQCVHSIWSEYPSELNTVNSGWMNATASQRWTIDVSLWHKSKSRSNVTKCCCCCCCCRFYARCMLPAYMLPFKLFDFKNRFATIHQVQGGAPLSKITTNFCTMVEMIEGNFWP